ncbi:hypothetical protein FACS1894110_12050 [Spirochaetia bacterium]|nr:hypothetical protein FACS1894110_12050 [Spirochaetia bacterium]
MAHSDWIPAREQDLADLAEKWTTTLADTAKQTAFGRVAAECTATAGKITAFLTARSAYEADKAKTAYYATCYENGKGEQGPWSPIVDAVIA